MATVTHPVFPDQKRVVPDDSVESWTNSGWTVVEGDGALSEDITLSSFEDALLDQQGLGQPEAEKPPTYTPNLIDDVKEA